MTIVLQNERLIAVDKPHGWLTTPARQPDDPRPCLGRELQERLGRQIYPVHRLDFEVSGLVLFALDKPSHTVAQKWFEDQLVEKTYEAMSAVGVGLPREGEWQEWRSVIARGKKRSFEAAHGKPSLTRARVVSVKDELVRWELQPKTGRPHQLRFEMAKHGFAILGDRLYGGRTADARDWIALRAVKLDFSRCGDALGFPEVLSVAGLP